MFSNASKLQTKSLNDEYSKFRSKQVKFLQESFSNTNYESGKINKFIPTHPDSSMKLKRNPSKSKEKPISIANVTLKDLCAEDKAKIGELIKKFAEEKKEKEELLLKLEEKQMFFDESMKEIRIENEQVALESLELKEKFKHSINMLKNLQKNSDQHKEKLDFQQKNREKNSPLKVFSVQETEKNSIFNTKSLLKEKPIQQSFSPKREILKFSSGETERKLLKIEKNRKLMEETVNLNSGYERKNEIKEKKTEEKEKTSSEICKLKEEIDNLAISLKKLKMSSPEKSQKIRNSINKPQETSKKNSPPSNKKQLPPQKFNNKAPNPSRTLYFQNLDPTKNLQKSNKTQAINIIDNLDSESNKELKTNKTQAINIIDKVDSQSDEELDEDIEIARKWLDNKKRKFQETHQKKSKIIETPTFEENSNDKINEITNYNMFSQKNLWNLRSYLDKKLEDFPEKNEQKQSISQLQTKNLKEKPLRDELSTPKPQKFMEEPIQYKQPSFIENSQLFSEKSNKSQKNENLLELFKESLQKEVKNEINNSLKKLNFNEVLEEKIKEFIYIKDRVLEENNEKSLKNVINNGNLEKKEFFKKKEKFVNKKCFFDEENRNEYSVKPFDIKEKNTSEKNPLEIKKNFFHNKEIHPNFVQNSQSFTKNSNDYDQNSKENLKNIDKNLQNNNSKDPQNFERNAYKNPQFEEEISELLNYNEDFYENGLFDLIDEIDNAEFIRSQSKNRTNSFIKPLGNQINSQKTETSSLEEIIEENRNFTNSSYIETDASVNYIKRQIKEMEESKRNKSKY